MDENNGLLDEKQLANFFGLKPKTLAMWRSRGTGPKFVRLANQSIRYRREDVEAYLADRTIDADAPKED